MYIVIAIIAFGVLIATHELGHFAAAKACGVRVNEFAIGMGPAILKKQGKETKYALRILPIGGYCALEGEDEDSGDARAFSNQKIWKQILILVAGSFMNFLVGLVVVVAIFSQYHYFGSNTIESFLDGFPSTGESGLIAGDTIVAIDGERVWYSDDFSTFMERADGNTVDITVIRDGERITLQDYELTKREYVVDGQTVEKYGINFEIISATFGEKLKYSLYTTGNFVRYVRLGLSDLVSGAVGINDLSGPVGIVSTINDVGQSSGSSYAAVLNVSYLCAFVAVNLAVMNMLPIPALDGGRVFLILVRWVIEKITRKRINRKFEGYIHATGLVLLLGLMAYVMFNDILRIFHG